MSLIDSRSTFNRKPCLFDDFFCRRKRPTACRYPAITKGCVISQCLRVSNLLHPSRNRKN